MEPAPASPRRSIRGSMYILLRGPCLNPGACVHMRGLGTIVLLPITPYAHTCVHPHANKLIQLICIIHATCRPGLGDFSCDSRPVSPSPRFSFFVLPSIIMCFVFWAGAVPRRCFRWSLLSGSPFSVMQSPVCIAKAHVSPLPRQPLTGVPAD